MKFFTKLYDLVMRWAQHKYAVAWLALVSFTEASCFVVPPDVMLAPMSLAKPKSAWFYASLTTVMSVLGGLVGYLIGMYAFTWVEPYLVSWGYMPVYDRAVSFFQEWGALALFIAGFTPIPFKVFTVAAGAANMMLLPFVLGSFIGRGGRFFIVAALMRFGGAPFEAKLRQWVDYLGWAVVVIILGYIAFKI